MKRGMGWPIGITVILGLTVAANIWVMRVANDDPSFAIEPDYYKKAVQFDSTMASERRSAALGWTATSSIVTVDAKGATVTVTLRDAQQQPVTGASVRIAALANARANTILSANLTETAPGQYSAPLAAQRPGQWEVRVDATRGTDRFVASTRTDLAVVPTSAGAAQGTAHGSL